MEEKDQIIEACLSGLKRFRESYNNQHSTDYEIGEVLSDCLDDELETSTTIPISEEPQSALFSTFSTVPSSCSTIPHTHIE